MKFLFSLKTKIPCVIGILLLLGGSALGATITADKLEYFKDEQRYVAEGNVRIMKDSTVVTADEAVYFAETGDTELTGHVTIDDKDYLINTEEAEFNIDDKTGELNNAVIYFKKDEYWIRGVNMQKLGESHYYAKTVYFTTCDSESYRSAKVLTFSDIPASQEPDWCFKGHDADIVVGSKMTARNATYRVKDIPVLYSPYFSAPVGSGRETGFLIPAVGTSSGKGIRFSPAFFWAIDENKDATFGIDYYSKRGVGTGVEYRFLDFDHEGTWYAYHIRDTELHKDFFELKASDRYSLGNIKAFLDINYINDEAFYKEYPKDFKSSISRFLQSTGEVSVPLNNSRLYFLSQYWVNLREGVTEHVPQKLPEIGYVVNPTAVGPLIFTLSANAANFYRSQEPHGQRLDIKPALSYSFGDSVRLTQTVSVRETAYNLNDGGEFGSSPHREMFQYYAQAQTRFLKDYGSFRHIIEPSLEFSYIPSAKVLPLFDSTELPSKTAMLKFVLYNKFVFRDLDISLRFSQPYDFNADNSNMLVDNYNSVLDGTTSLPTNHHLQPTRLEGAVAGPALPINFTFDVAYDFVDNRINNLNSVFSFKIFRDITLGLGERYSRVDNLMLYTLGINAPLDKHWVFSVSASYDAKGPGVRDLSIKTTYKEQCWAADFLITRRPADQFRPADYSYLLMLELKGIGSFKF
ncbi:MAG TPA: LPS assembly protein LptD [Dissulfurispiraceae bacterium]|nr:LPS assembly protein LptD [Dissulfurispiraceae bacterium]